MHFHGRGRYGKLHLTLKLHLTGRGRYGQPPSHGTRSPAGSCRAVTEGPFKSAEAENTVKRSSRRTGVNLQYFRVEPTSLGSERGEQPLSCNDDDRCLRQKQGGVVGAVASRMQGPLKGRSIRWEPQPVQGRGVSRGREGGVETPLSPSGPAERPRRRCILQKASDLPYAATLCAGKDDLELPPLCSGNRSGNIIFYSRLSRSAERSKRIFTGGVVPGSCIRCCWPAAKSQHFSVPAYSIKTFCCYI